MADLVLPGVEVFGDAFNNSAWDQSYQEQLYSYLNSLAQGQGGGDAPPAGFEAFAPPTPEVLPEIKVTPRPAPPPAAPAPGLGSVVLDLLGRVLPVVGGLLYPLPTGPGRPGELNEPLPGDPERPIPLPEVEVVATRIPPAPPPTPPATAMPGDPWPFNLDPLEWYADLPGQRPFVPFTGAEPGPGVVRDRDPQLIGDPVVAPTPAPATRPSVRPLPSPGAPDLVPAPTPELSPGPWLDPFVEPVSRPGTRPSPGPGFIENPGTFADPTLNPFQPFRTPTFVPDVAPRAPGAPLQLLEPFSPGAPQLAQPFETPPPSKTDRCSCADGGKKKKPKKRKPRSICYRGTYTETSKSLRKVRREQVPCK